MPSKVPELDQRIREDFCEEVKFVLSLGGERRGEQHSDAGRGTRRHKPQSRETLVFGGIGREVDRG